MNAGLQTADCSAANSRLQGCIRLQHIQTKLYWTYRYRYEVVLYWTYRYRYLGTEYWYYLVLECTTVQVTRYILMILVVFEYYRYHNVLPVPVVLLVLLVLLVLVLVLE